MGTGSMEEWRYRNESGRFGLLTDLEDNVVPEHFGFWLFTQQKINKTCTTRRGETHTLRDAPLTGYSHPHPDRRKRQGFLRGALWQ